MLPLPTTAIEVLLNQALGLDPDSPGRLASLTGKVIRVELTGLDTALVFLPHDQDLEVRQDSDRSPDVTLRGSPLALLRAAAGGRTDDVEIDGDPQLAQRFSRLLQGLDIDWEEQASRLVGDPLAHQAGRLLRGLGDWGRQALDTLGRDGGEYLQRESRLLPPRDQIHAFLDAVDRLREDTDRLEARIRRLEARLPPAGTGSNSDDTADT